MNDEDIIALFESLIKKHGPNDYLLPIVFQRGIDAIKEVERLNKTLEQIQSDLFSVRGFSKKHDEEITVICGRIRQVLNGGEYDE